MLWTLIQNSALTHPTRSSGQDRVEEDLLPAQGVRRKEACKQHFRKGFTFPSFGTCEGTDVDLEEAVLPMPGTQCREGETCHTDACLEAKVETCLVSGGWLSPNIRQQPQFPGLLT